MKKQKEYYESLINILNKRRESIINSEDKKEVNFEMEKEKMNELKKQKEYYEKLIDIINKRKENMETKSKEEEYKDDDDKTLTK